MAICELTGKKPVVKNLVSHSNIKTKSTNQPNIQKKSLFSKTLNQMLTLKVSSRTIRSIDHVGGFDNFILKQDPEKMSARALTIYRRLQRKISAKKTASSKKTEV